MKKQFFEIHNNGGTIRGIIDYNDELTEGPLVVILPAFETRAYDFINMSVFFTANGFRVLRFDPINSVGLSSGDFINFTMNGLIKDIDSVFKYIEQENLAGDSGITVIAISLSARAVYRYLAVSKRKVDFLITLVGVVNMRSTIRKVTGQDDFKRILFDGIKKGICKLFLREIDCDKFAFDSKKIFSFMSALRDAGKIRATNVLEFISEKDEWINVRQKVKFNRALKHSKAVFKIIGGAQHKIWLSTDIMKDVLKYMVVSIKKNIMNCAITEESVKMPTLSDVSFSIKAERKYINKIQTTDVIKPTDDNCDKLSANSSIV